MNDLHYDGRILLIYLAVKYKGDFQKVLSALIMKDIDVPYEEAMKVFKSLPCQVITYLDYDYPKKLKQVYRPPLVLFYYGDISLLEKQNIAVVGSRKYSDYGKECTEKVVSSIIKGRVLVSGLAKGIDSIAHQCAIDSGGKTIAVLGSGIDYCYPSENQKLYEEIKKNHLLISEYPFNSAPDKDHFPMRNRIIAGLADAMYIPQINSYASGTMISINLALSLGKEIYVAPQPIDSGTINNQLLNEGASVVSSISQMLTDLGWAEK